jgi:DNA-binding response OmpR family regulator
VGDTTPAVLVLDDEPGIRDSLQRLLLQYGYSPIAAATLDEATQLMAATPVDALIIDVRLGQGHTGLELLESLRMRPGFEKTPVIVFTGGVLSDAEKGLITRMRAYLFVKPEGFRSLLQFLDTLTGRDQQH